MAKNKLVGSILNLVLIVIMSFFCISLTSSGKQLNDKLKINETTNVLKTETIIVKYHLINNGDTVIVDRKLDSISE